MATTKLEKQIADLRAFLPRLGYTEDRFGHYVKDALGRPNAAGTQLPIKVRIKFQDTSVRYETKPAVGGEWYKLDGAYFKDITYPDANSVKIGRRTFTVKP